MIVRHAEAIARRKVNGPPLWRWCIARAHKGGLLIKGAVPLGTYSKGRRKGEPKWPRVADLDVAIVSDADYATEYARYEREEGRCAECFGEGEVFASWNHETGSKFRPCRRCGGTGKAAQESPCSETP
jgi:hypothetical protein